jgi:CubicO group peptidase (beta-lactamase class C family)
MFSVGFRRKCAARLALIAVLLAAPGAYATEAIATAPPSHLRVAQRTVDEAIDNARRKFSIPAITISVIENDLPALASTRGVRAHGHDVQATEQDVWLIGSCGKIMTAVMIMRLADRGLLKLDAPIGPQLPPALFQLAHPGIRQATLAQMLSHTSGLDEDPALTDGLPKEASSRFTSVADGPTRAQWQAASLALQQKPQHAPGKFFQYSNFGYIIAATIASHATGKSWRQLMIDEVFQPLNMSSAGFGAPGGAARMDQPRGHAASWKWLVIPQLRAMTPGDPKATLPDFYAPAGLIHMRLTDWGKFLVMIHRGYRQQSAFLSAASFARLLAPAPAQNYREYALGIQVARVDHDQHLVFSHTGSDGYWRAHFRVDTKKNRIVMMAANLGADDVDRAFDELAKVIDSALTAP